jgi:type IV pilus assembly protein PilB
VLDPQEYDDETVDECIERLGFMPGREIVETLAAYHQCPVAELEMLQPDPAAVALLSREIADRCEAVPIGWVGSGVRVVMSDPSDVLAEDTIRAALSRSISVGVARQSHVTRLIDQLYGPSAEAMEELDQLPAPYMDNIEATEPAWMSAQELEMEAERLPTIRIVNQILGVAVYRGASDVHIEPQETSIAVRIRVDGVLLHFLTLPKGVQSSVVSRIKLMGNMDISDSRRPQDGRCRVSFNRRSVDMRISSLPTTYGENIVIRILDQSGPPMTIESLDLAPEHHEQIVRMLARPQGILLVTGPTGSGKSTSLYAALVHLRQTGTNIVTVEDPVERQIVGVSQVAINERAGVTFASALRSILRQDPNIIMVGEIRDAETAQIALQAGLTGHLVLSTLHTNDTTSTVTRLLDMGIPGHLLSPGLLGVVSQRLVRRLCADCHGQETGDPRHPKGCRECGYTGYRGRVGIFEVMEMNPALAALISRGATAEELRAVACAMGMRLLADDALVKVNAGVTTMEEASTVVDMSAGASMALLRNIPGVTLGGQTAPGAWGQAQPGWAAQSGQFAGAQPIYGGAAPGAMGMGSGPTAAPQKGNQAPFVQQAPGHHSGPKADAQSSEPCILVVEDSQSIRRLLVDTLEKNFFKVVEAEDGLDGMKQALATHPDLCGCYYAQYGWLRTLQTPS